MNSLIEQNLKLAYSEAIKYRPPRDSEQLDDLKQIAVIGLIKSAAGFDPTRGHTFSTYAVPKIRGELHHWFRDGAHEWI